MNRMPVSVAVAVFLFVAGCISRPPPTSDYTQHVTHGQVLNRGQTPPPSATPLTESALAGEWEMVQSIVQQTTVRGTRLKPTSKKRSMTINFTGRGQCSATLYDYNRSFTNTFKFDYEDGRITFTGGSNKDKAFWFLDASRFEIINCGGDFFELKYLDLPVYSKQQVHGVISSCFSKYLSDGSLEVKKHLDSSGQTWEYRYSPMIFRRLSASSSPRPNSTTAPAPRSKRMSSAPKARTPRRVRYKEKKQYDIHSLVRTMEGGFSYRFELELVDGKEASLKTIKAVKQDFRKAIRDDYAESFFGSSVASLFVEFPQFMFSDGKISGKAVVMSMVVMSMKYDPLTRTGRMAVCLNGGQFEETRKWIRKNIETLARDKNIALVTGEIPPAAKFYLGREELKDGNILEIEFKTE